MIGGKLARTDNNYFAMEKDSSSSIKAFVEDRRKYYKKYVAGESVEEPDEENKAILIGNLVDCLLCTPHEFNNRFYESKSPTKPTAQRLAFINHLYDVTMENTEDGVVQLSFEDISKEAYNRTGFKRDKYEGVIKKFVEEGEKEYFDEILAVRPKGLQVISLQDLDNATKILNELRNNEFVKDVVNADDDNNTEVHNQLVIEFELDGLLLKLMIDKVIVHHNELVINPYDLKVTWNVEKFYSEYYLYRKAYIPAVIYTKGVRAWADANGFEKYAVMPLKFIVADSINYMGPLIYDTSFQDLEDGYNGFTHKFTEYKGVRRAIEEILWHKETGIWNYSMENYMNQGIKTLK